MTPERPADLTHVACPLCGSTGCRVLFNAHDLNCGNVGSFTYGACTRCGLVYENPRPEGETLGRYYPPSYGGLLQSCGTEADKRIDSGVNHYRAAAIERFVPAGMLFDVGCGSGFFLEHMRRKGWRVAGIDSSPGHVAFAQEQLHLAGVKQDAWPVSREGGERYDVVTMFHVLEHMPSPLRAISAAKSLLKPHGLLAIETPNIESWPARFFRKNWVTLDAPRHLVLFSAMTLRRCLETAGYTPVRLDTYSPSTMEYSESLRYALRSLRNRPLREATGQHDGRMGKIAPENSTVRRSGYGLLDMLHAAEKLTYCFINSVANRLGNGCNLFAVARLQDSAGRS